MLQCDNLWLQRHYSYLRCTFTMLHCNMGVLHRNLLMLQEMIAIISLHLAGVVPTLCDISIVIAEVY